MLQGYGLRLLAVAALVAMWGCGGGSSAAGSDGLLSCDIRPECGGQGADHVCIASTGYGKVPGDSTGTKNDCLLAGGTLGTTCDLTGAVAGCRGVGAGAGSYLTTTYWYYTGTVQDVMAMCLSPMTLVLPDAGAGGGDAGQPAACPSGAAGAGGSGAGGAAGGTGGGACAQLLSCCNAASSANKTACMAAYDATAPDETACQSAYIGLKSAYCP